MATKKAVNGNNLEYIIIRPKGGYNKSTIADGILLGETDIERIKKQCPTYNKLIFQFKENLLEFDLENLSYTWERVGHYTDYEAVHKKMVAYISELNPNLS